MSSIAPRDRAHVVQFYGDDDELSAAAFVPLAAKVASGDAAVVIATPRHVAVCRQAFLQARIDVDRAVTEGRVQLFDAADMLPVVVVNGRVDRAALDRAVGDVIRTAGAVGRQVHVFGEMVALLWGDGNVAGALELEELWEDLGAELAFSLHCGYPAPLMADPRVADAFATVCGLHVAVIGDAPMPLESDVARHFVKDPRSPRAARRFVIDTLSAWDDADLLDECQLVVAELATNAVVHADSSFTVALSRRSSGVHIVVGDVSSLPARPVDPDRDRPGGRGLQVVDGVAARWGCDLVDGGKLVWADVDAPVAPLESEMSR